MTITTNVRGGADLRRAGLRDRDRSLLSDLTRRLSNTSRLASIALEGPEPEEAVAYLYDALEMLRGELARYRHLRPPDAEA